MDFCERNGEVWTNVKTYFHFGWNRYFFDPLGIFCSIVLHTWHGSFYGSGKDKGQFSSFNLWWVQLLSWLKYTLTKESADRVYFNLQFTLAVTYLYNYVCFSFLLAITNTIGELFCGWISDRSFVNSLTVYNTYVFITGISIFFMPFCYSYIQFVSVISVYGFFSGFDTCESIICVEILGKNLLF